MSQYITKIRTAAGDLQIDYNALANKPPFGLPSTGANGTILTSDTTHYEPIVTSGTHIGTLTINNKSTDIYASDFRVDVISTNPTSSTTYYPVWSSTNSGTTLKLNTNDGFQYSTCEGTTSVEGNGVLSLGNNKAIGTAGNKTGNVRLYSSSTGYGDLYQSNTTSALQHYLPAVGGTLINEKNISDYAITFSGGSSGSGAGLTATVTELNYCDGVTSNIQTQLNNKADKNHGTHVTYGTSASALGTSSAGSASTVSRSDHVHALPALTSCTGTLTVAKGGTGSQSKSGARTNLGITSGTSLPSSGEEGDIFILHS